MMTLPMSLLLETIEPYAMECEPNPERGKPMLKKLKCKIFKIQF